jgi:hypothetical protein
MTSAKETYACQTYHNCSSPYETKPGIWGSGEKKELWEFPVVPVDYNSLTLDLLTMKDAANEAGTYYGKSHVYGYQVEFNGDGTVTIGKVTAKGTPVKSWGMDDNWQTTSHDVGTVELIETRVVENGSVYYFEDMVWVKGTVTGRVTVAAGVFPDVPKKNVDIILNGNITYGGVRDGSRAFAAIAQRHVLIPWSGAQDNMTLEGAFVAQKGSFHRRYYCANLCGADEHRIKTSLNRYGMMASNGVPVTTWVNEGGVVSGYLGGEEEYDPSFIYGPPPYFPTNGQYEFISWEEL